MKKFLIICLVVFISLNIYAARTAKITYMKGKVEAALKSGEWQPAKLNMELKQGSHIRTYLLSEASILLDDGSVIKIKENSIINLDTLTKERGDKKTNINMLVGKIRAIVKDKKATEVFKVETPVAVAGVRGTDFGVSTTSDESELVVFGSLVEWTNEKGQSVMVEDGQKSIIKKGSAPSSPEDLSDEDAEKYGLRGGLEDEEEQDNESPEIKITNNTRTAIKEGEPLTVKAKITDNNAVERAALLYRQLDEEGGYNEIEMVLSGNNEYQAIIPGEDIVATAEGQGEGENAVKLGIEYYVYANDGKNEASSELYQPWIIPKKEEVKDEVPPAAPEITGEVEDGDVIKIKEVNITGTAEPASIVYLTVNGKDERNLLVGEDGEFSFNGVYLYEGENSIKLYAKDNAGNKSSESIITVTVDSTAPEAPEITQVSPVSEDLSTEDKKYTKSDNVQITGTAEDGADVVLEINGTEESDIQATGGSFNFSSVSLDEGENSVKVYAIDENENKSAASAITIIKDSRGPSAPASVDIDGAEKEGEIYKVSSSVINIKASGITDENDFEVKAYAVINGSQQELESNGAGDFALSGASIEEDENEIVIFGEDALGNKGEEKSVIVKYIEPDVGLEVSAPADGSEFVRNTAAPQLTLIKDISDVYTNKNTVSITGNITFAQTFELPFSIQGKTEPQANVTVNISGSVFSATADGQGNFSIEGITINSEGVEVETDEGEEVPVSGTTFNYNWILEEGENDIGFIVSEKEMDIEINISAEKDGMQSEQISLSVLIKGQEVGASEYQILDSVSPQILNVLGENTDEPDVINVTVYVDDPDPSSEIKSVRVEGIELYENSDGEWEGEVPVAPGSLPDIPPLPPGGGEVRWTTVNLNVEVEDNAGNLFSSQFPINFSITE